MKRTRKGQAALEFLTTYGWAIMVVLVMIGALAYFGVFNASDLLPPKCVFTTGITCRDYAAFDNGGDLQFMFLLENGLGTSIRIPQDQVVVSANGLSAVCTNGSWPLTIGAGETRTFVCAGLGAGTSPGISQRTKASVNLNYTEVNGVFVHPISGEIQTAVQ